MIGLIGAYVLMGLGLACGAYALWLDYKQTSEDAGSIREGRRWR